MFVQRNIMAEKAKAEGDAECVVVFIIAEMVCIIAEKGKAVWKKGCRGIHIL